MATNYWGDDAWETRGRRPSPYAQRSDNYLAPVHGADLHRSRSTGQAPVPTINVYNRVNNDQESYTPYPPSRSPSRGRASPRRSPQMRSYRLGDNIVEDLAEMELDRQRYRSRSRGRSDASGFDRQQAYNEFALAQRENELRDGARKREWEREESRIRDEMRYKNLHEDEIKRLDHQRYEDELKAKLLAQELKDTKDRESAKQREKQWEDEYERKKRDAADKAKAEEKRIKDEIELKEREEKDRADREYKAFIHKQEDDKKKKEEDYEKFLQMQKEKEDKKKKEAKESEEKFQEEMRHRLRTLGYSEKTIEIMVDKEKSEKFKSSLEHEVVDRTEIGVYRPATMKAPIFPKVRREFIAVETLQYYDLPWEYDRNNPDYIIILRDMSQSETDILFEHTKRLHSSKLLIESSGKKKKPEYQWVRKRSKSRSGNEKRVSLIELR